jgi:glycosyltransferase involved in cell wall biosynthesis
MKLKKDFIMLASVPGWPSVNKPSHVFILPWSPKEVGGVSSVVNNLCNAMIAKNQIQPIVWIIDWDAYEPQIELKESGVIEMRWRIHPLCDETISVKSLKKALWEARQLKMLNYILHYFNVDVINSHFPGDAAFGLMEWLLSVSKKLPVNPSVVLSFHGSDIVNWNEKPKRTKEKLKKLISKMRGAGFHVTGTGCSSALCDQVNQVIGIPDFSWALHNGVNSEVMVNADAKAKPKELIEPYIINIGKFDNAIKGQLDLIKAFALVSGSVEQNLVLVGGSSNEIDNLIKPAIVSLGLQKRVHIFSNVPHDEIGAYLRDADAFVLSSRREAFAISLMEAGVLHVPVLAPNIPGVMECLGFDAAHDIAQCETGVLFERAPNNEAQHAQALSNGIKQVLGLSPLKDAAQSIESRIKNFLNLIEEERDWGAVTEKLRNGSFSKKH